MRWITFAPLLLSTLLLLLQGCSYLLGREREHLKNRYAGALTILLAAMSIVLYVSLSTGALLLSTEFRLLLAQGTAAWIGLGFLVIGLSAAPALAWQAVRYRVGLPSRTPWILGAAALCSILGVMRMPLLISEEGVRYFDRWWPPAVIWIAVCGAELLIALLRVDGTAPRIWGGVLLPVGFALYVVYHSHLGYHYADPWTLILWEMILITGLSAVMASGTYLVLDRMKLHRWVKRLVSAGLGIAGLISAVAWITEPDSSRLPFHLRPWVLWLAWVLLLAGFFAKELWDLWRARKLERPEINMARRIEGAIAALMVALIAAGFVDVVHFGRYPPTWDLVLVTAAWTALLEVAGGGPIRALFFHSGLPSEKSSLVEELESPLRKAGKAAYPGFQWLGGTLRALFESLFTAQNPAAAVMKLVLLLVLFVACSIVPYAGKIVVSPFAGESAEADKTHRDLGRLASDRVVNTLGLVAAELQPDMTIYQPGESGSGKNAPKLAPAGGGVSGIEAQTKNFDVELWGTKIPLGWFTDTLRWALGVRVIYGSVQRQGDSYVLLSSSSRGESWRTDSAEGLPEPKAGAPSDTRATELTTALADQIAYMIISSDPKLVRFGITPSWRALKAFHEGAKQWSRYEERQDYKALSDSIVKFREAIRFDPGFALAHYRLGRALASDGQPGMATEAFRSAVGANPHFSAAHLALGNIDNYLDEYVYGLPPGMSGTVDFVRPWEERIAEARDHWRQAIRVSGAEGSNADRAAAYTAFCQDTLDRMHSRSTAAREAATPGLTAAPYPEEQRYQDAYRAFFYCGKAEYLYSQVSAASRADSQVATGEANALYLLGYTLQLAGRQKIRILKPAAGQSEPAWHCSAHTVRDGDIGEDGTIRQRRVWDSLFARESLAYYRRAKAILPQDPVIGCAMASATFASGDGAAMEQLAANASPHMELARQFREQAARPDVPAAKYFQLALEEYQSAIDHAPLNTEALNNYAYTFWEWNREALRRSAPAPAPEIGQRAEAYAEEAGRLTLTTAWPSRQAEVESTLGEVLLAEGKFQKAINVLTGAYQKVSGYQHAYFNEIRFDLAQAYLGKSRCRSNPNTTRLLNDIREIEKTRESRLFTDALDEQEKEAGFGLCRQPAGL